MNRYSIFGIITAVLFAILPFATSRHLFHAAVNAKFFLVIGGVLILAAIAAVFFYKGRPIQFRDRPLLWAGAALLAVYWLSAFFGIFPERSIFADLQRSTGVFFLTHIAALSFILGEFFNERDWTLVRRTIALSAGAFAFFTLLGAEGFGIQTHIFWTNLAINGYTFGNSTFAGTYLLLAFVVALLELVRTPVWSRWWNTLVGSAALIFFSPILFNSGLFWGGTSFASVIADPMLILGSARASSAAAISLLIFFCGYLLAQKYAGTFKKRVMFAWGGLFVAAVFGGLALLFTPGSFVQQKYIESSTAARILVWEGGIQAFMERSLLGWGPENFEHALQEHLDNRLYEDENIGEIWFDRAHNVVVNTLVDVGFLGVLAYICLIGAYVRTVYRARLRELVSEDEAMILYALPLAHFLQLQTGFDTIGSFTLLGFLGGYGLWLEKKMLMEPVHGTQHGGKLYRTLGTGVLSILLAAGVYFTFAELNRQNALYRIFTTTETERSLSLIKTATSRLSAFEILRLSSLSLTKGVLQSIGERRATKESIEGALAQITLYEEQYRRYIERQPDYYRARTALAYLLSVKLVLGGENDIEEAKELVAKGHELSPNNLLTPAMEALLELYSGNLSLAKSKAEEIVALNPDAAFGREILAHIEKQEQTFPEITVLKLENL